MKKQNYKTNKRSNSNGKSQTQSKTNDQKKGEEPNRGSSTPKTDVNESSDKQGDAGKSDAGRGDSRQNYGQGGNDVDGNNGKNDPTWYSKDSQLFSDATSIPFSHPFGGTADILRPTNGIVYQPPVGPFVQFKNNAGRFRNPGFINLLVKPTFGGSKSESDAINIAAHMLYTNVRFNSSGRKNYDQTDLMLYCLAVSELYAYIFWMKRIYNAAFMTSQRSLYLPKLLEAVGGDPSLAENLSAFRSWINLKIAQISTLVVPAEIDLFKRRAFIYASIYSEHDSGDGVGSIMDQIYLFSPAYFMKFDYDEKHAGCLIPIGIDGTRSKPVGEYLVTLDDIKSIGNQLFANIIGNEDFSLMGGDLLRTYANNIIGIESQPEEGVLIPVFDEFTLSQMKNATLLSRYIIYDGATPAARGSQDFYPLGDDWTTYTVPNSLIDPTDLKTVRFGGVYQDAKGIIHSRERVALDFYRGSPNAVTAITGNYIWYTGDSMIASVKHDVSPDFVIEATRLKVTAASSEQVHPSGSANTTVFEVADVKCGSDIVLGVRVTTLIDVFNGSTFDLTTRTETIRSNFVYHSDNTPVVASVVTDELLMTTIHAKWFPLLWLLRFEVSTTNVEDTSFANALLHVVDPLFDTGVFTLQTPAVIQRMSDMAMLSLCATPGVSKLI